MASRAGGFCASRTGGFTTSRAGARGNNRIPEPLVITWSDGILSEPHPDYPDVQGTYPLTEGDHTGYHPTEPTP